MCPELMLGGQVLRPQLFVLGTVQWSLPEDFQIENPISKELSETDAGLVKLALCSHESSGC